MPTVLPQLFGRPLGEPPWSLLELAVALVGHPLLKSVGLDEFRRDAHGLPFLQHRALGEMSYAERSRNFRDRRKFPLEQKYRGSAEDPSTRHTPEPIDHRRIQPVGKTHEQDRRRDF